MSPSVELSLHLAVVLGPVGVHDLLALARSTSTGRLPLGVHAGTLALDELLPLRVQEMALLLVGETRVIALEYRRLVGAEVRLNEVVFLKSNKS